MAGPSQPSATKNAFVDSVSARTRRKGASPEKPHEQRPKASRQPAEAKDFVIELGIDFGISGVKVTHRVLRRGDGTMRKAQSMLFMNNTKDTIPTYIACQDVVFYCGFDVEEHLKRARMPELKHSKIIDNFKLLLYEPFMKEHAKTADQALRREKLDRKSPEKFLREFFNYLIPVLQERLCEIYAGYFESAVLLAIELRARLSTPVLWSPEARRMMTEAAREAGVHFANTVSEPMAAVAQWLEDQEANGHLPPHLNVGDKLIEVDCGCGTVDVAELSLKDPLSPNARFVAVQQVCGPLAGSFRVNEYLLDLANKELNIGETAKSFGVEPSNIFWQLNEGIEEWKKKYRDLPPNGKPISISGARDGQVVYFNITKERIEAAHEKSLRLIKSMIDEICDKGMPKAMLVTGGFSQSEVLMNFLRNTYGQKVNVLTSDKINSFLVAEGILSRRYALIDTQKLPSRFGYSLLGDETANPDLHPDCYKRVGEEMIEIKKRVMPSRYDSNFNIVIDRQTIVSQIGTGTSGLIKKTIPREYPVDPNDPFLEDQIVYTDRHFDDHEGALILTHNAAKKDNPYREGVRYWGSVKAELSKDELKGCKRVRVRGAKTFVWVEAQLNFKYTDENNIEITYDVTAGDNKFSKSGELWNAKYSEFAEDVEGDRMVDSNEEEEEDVADRHDPDACGSEVDGDFEMTDVEN